MDKKAGPKVEISLMEMAVIIVEEISNTRRKDGLEPAELMTNVCCGVQTALLGAAAIRAATRIGEYVKTSAETVQAMRDMGAI